MLSHSWPFISLELKYIFKKILTTVFHKAYLESRETLGKKQ